MGLSKKEIDELLPMGVTLAAIERAVGKKYLLASLHAKELDNYFRLKILKALEKRSYYISELQREVGIKVYKSIHDTLKVLDKLDLICKEQKHNTSGRQVVISLNKKTFEDYKILVKELQKKHKI